MNVYEINNLKILRKTDIGYILIDQMNTEVFMHFKEASKEYEENEEVSAFLFYDKHHRLAATDKEVSVTLSSPNFISVKSINDDLGAFLDNNCSKDLLISKDNLPLSKELWPVVDDLLLIKLKIKEKSVTARLCSKEDILSLSGNVKFEVGDVVEAYVCKITNSGIGLVTNDHSYIFVHLTQMRREYRLGELCECRILQVKEEDYNGSLLELKEKMIDTDADIILSYLKRNNGRMSFTAKSSSADIEETFKMSKKAFKRAIGSLYKLRIIDFDDSSTFLVE